MTTARDKLVRIICESWDDEQCSCIVAPETRGSFPNCKSPFAAADAILCAPDSIRQELAALLNPPEKGTELTRLRDAIVENTKGDLFWIGEILLAELEKETGFRPPPSEDK